MSDLKHEVTRHQEVIASTQDELHHIKQAAVQHPRSDIYRPVYNDSQDFVEHSDRGDVAPYIAQAADDLRKDIQWNWLSSLLS